MTEEKPRPAYTRYHWAKSDRENPGRIHLLEHHLADVGACFEALMRQPTIRQRLAAAGGLNDLDESLIARLSVFAALHDIGKVNMGFQTQIWRNSDLPDGRRLTAFYGAGHYRELVPVLTDQDYTTAGWFFDALGWDDFLAWDHRDGETVCAMLVATLSHHGRPLQLEGGPSENPAIWRKFGDLKPEDCVKRVGKLLRRWFPAAFEQGGCPLPSAPAFQHMFLGLCNWADWIGSNEKWFPYVDASQDDYIRTARERAKQAVDAIGLNLSSQRYDFKGVPEFRNLFGIDDSPNAIQKAAHEEPLNQKLVIIESETVVAGIAIVTVPLSSGSTANSHLTFLPASSRRALDTSFGLNPAPSWPAEFDGVGLGVVSPCDRDRDIGKGARGRVYLVAVGAGIRVTGADGDRGIRVRGGRG